MLKPRTRLQACLFATALICAATGVAAQESSRTTRLIVPYGAGTATDIAARAIAEKLAERTGKGVVVDNRPGANGIVAIQAVTSAPANGETLLFTNHSPFVINPHLYAGAGRDVARLTPVSLVTTGSYLMVANPSAGVQSVADLIKKAQASPGKVSYASYGVGSGPHLCMEMIQSSSKISLLHIPYKTGSLTDVVAGQVDVSTEPIANATPFVKEGKLKALAFTDERLPQVLPQVPAVSETIPGYRCDLWLAIFGPAAMKTTPQLSQLNESLRAIVAMPDIQKKIQDLGLVPKWAGPEEVERMVANDSRKWGDLIKQANIKVD